MKYFSSINNEKTGRIFWVLGVTVIGLLVSVDPRVPVIVPAVYVLAVTATFLWKPQLTRYLPIIICAVSFCFKYF
jgi:hypothetical protein